VSRLVTVVAVIDVPDDYDVGADSVDCFAYALDRVPATRFGVVFDGVSAAAVGAGTSEAAMTPTRTEQARIDAGLPPWVTTT
jgi:hypothetical protein